MRKLKPWHELTFQDDYMFKLVMSQKPCCQAVLELILRIPIRDIRYIEDEKSIRPLYGSKGIRLDVYVADANNTVFDVEMQVKSLGGAILPKRSRYYQSTIDVERLLSGVEYDELSNTYVIFICPFALFDGQRHIYTFTNICREDKNLELGDGTTKIFLSTKGKLNDVPENVKAFLNYVDGIKSADPLVQSIDTLIKDIKEREGEMRNYMDYSLKFQDAMRDEYKKGHKEGLNQGRLTTLVENIRNFAKTGLSFEEVMDILQVPTAERPAVLAAL